MVFKELKQNYTVYILNKEEMSCVEGRVVNVSSPRYENKIGQTPQMIVDITLNKDDTTTTYVFPADMSKAYNNNLIFSIDKSDVIADIKIIERNSQQILSQVENHKKNIEKCHMLLADLDTEEKERQRTEQRFSKLEDSMQSLNAMLSSFMKEWKGEKSI